jgi:hypothetical protein
VDARLRRYYRLTPQGAQRLEAEVDRMRRNSAVAARRLALLASPHLPSSASPCRRAAPNFFFFFGGPCWRGEYVVVGDTVIVPVTAGDVAVGGLDD